MDLVFELLAERRIADAIAHGDLDDLPGAGRPLDFADDPLIPPEHRMGNHILRNAGVAPGEILLRKEIARLRREIAALPPGESRSMLNGQLALLLIELCERRAS